MPEWGTPTSSGFSAPSSAYPPSIKRKKKKDHWYDVPGNFLEDVKDTAVGLALSTPRALGHTWHDAGNIATGKFHDFEWDDAVKETLLGVVEDYKYTYGDILTDPGKTLSKIKQHPLGPILDVLTLMSGGAAAASKAGKFTAVGSKGGLIKPAASASARARGAKWAGLERVGSVTDGVIEPSAYRSVVPKSASKDALGDLVPDEDLFNPRTGKFSPKSYAAKYLDEGASLSDINADIIDRISQPGRNGRIGYVNDYGEIYIPITKKVMPPGAERGGYEYQVSENAYKRARGNVVDKFYENFLPSRISAKGAKQNTKVLSDQAVTRAQALAAKLSRDRDYFEREHNILFKAFPVFHPGSSVASRAAARSAQVAKHASGEGPGGIKEASVGLEDAFLNSPEFKAIDAAMEKDGSGAKRAGAIIADLEKINPESAERVRAATDPKVIRRYKSFIENSVKAYYENIAPDMTDSLVRGSTPSEAIASRGEAEKIQNARSIAEENQFRELAKHRKGFTEADADNISSYSMHGFRDIQDSIRGATGFAEDIEDPELRQAVDDLDGAFRRAPVTEGDTVVYRGMDPEQLMELEDGSLYDFGYMSTSKDRRIAERFAGRGDGDVVKIIIPKGTPAIDVDQLLDGVGSTEKEVLLPRGSTIRLVDSDSGYVARYEGASGPHIDANKFNELDYSDVEADVINEYKEKYGIDIGDIRSMADATNFGLPILSHSILRDTLAQKSMGARSGMPSEFKPNSPEFKKTGYVSNEFALNQFNGMNGIIRAVEHAALAKESTARFRGLLSQMYKGEKSPGKGWVRLSDVNEKRLRDGISDVLSFLENDFTVLSGGSRIDMVDQMADTLKGYLDGLTRSDDVWVPNGALKALFPAVSENANLAKTIYSKSTRIWRDMTLGLRPQWMINNMVGNMTLLAMEHGLGTSLRALYSAYRDSDLKEVIDRDAPSVLESGMYRETTSGRNIKKARTDIDNDFIKFMKEQDPDASIGDTITKLELIKSKAKDVGNSRAINVASGRAGLSINAKMIDDPARRASFLANMAPHIKAMQERFERKTGQKMSRADALAELLKSDEIKDFAISKTLRDMIDYRDLNPFERQWVRGVFPFYAWLRGMSRRSIQFGLDRPDKLAVMAQISEQANDDPDFGDQYPEWMRRMARIDNDLIAKFIRGDEREGGTPAIDLGSMNIFQTPADVANLISAAMYGDMSKMTASGSIANYANPFLKSIVETLTGKNLYTGKDLPYKYTDPEKKANAILLERIVQSVPGAREIFESMQKQDPDYEPAVQEGYEIPGLGRTLTDMFGTVVPNSLVDDRIAIESETKRKARRKQELESAKKRREKMK